MNDTVIRVDNLSKLYKIGKREEYSTLRDAIARSFSNSFRFVKRLKPDTQNLTPNRKHPKPDTQDLTPNSIWALKDVSFEIKCGEVVGIIGRNGAGKSTLLKILSRITEPTEGYAEIRGRVGSLLEVGTGFHPELSGRENIYLNGAILGMKKAEIERKFDEIVAFAEVEKFIDTPVKHYSSGMYVRLAFAVAAHLEPEILLVDEVLAVGDVQFQKKCLGKMGDVAKEGRTVLFVSHNMGAIRGLCESAFLLNNGKLILKDNAENVVHLYLSEISASTEKRDGWIYRHHGRSGIEIDKVELLVNGIPSNSVQSGNNCAIRIHYHALTSKSTNSEISVSIILFSERQKLVNFWTNYYGKKIKILPRGIIECSIPKWPFRSHLIKVDIYTHAGPEIENWIEGCLFFDSYDGDYYSSGVITHQGQGLMFLDHKWSSYANE
jgi:lipopolysaccharide transport system ATP-binding protein